MSNLATIETLQRRLAEQITENERLRTVISGEESRQNELKSALSACWYLLPDGEYGSAGAAIKKTIKKFNCWPDPTKKIGESWQPIETAPTEPHSTAIIYAPSDTGEGNVGEAFLGKDGQWYWAGSEVGYHDPITDCNSPPTHWMPMPAKPKSQEAA